MQETQKSIGITVVIATKNEEINIQDAISSVGNFSEVVVVDSNSKDKTAQLASDFGAKLINFEWNGQYPKKRQWILENVNIANSWIFFLDADERMTPELESELRAFLALSNVDQYSAGLIKLSAFIHGTKLKFGYKTKGLRLLRKNEVEFPIVDDLLAPGMGEIEGHYQPLIRGKIFRLKSTLDHNDSDSFSDWYLRHIRYAEWDAWVRRSSTAKAVVYRNKYGFAWIFHRMPLKPILFFVFSYFLKFGFLDGRRGFTYALNYAWFYWLTDNIVKDSNL